VGGQDRTLAAIAARQHGVVTRAQVLAAGISARALEKRLDKGSLIKVYPGAYRVGHVAPSDEADYMAAVLACGDGAVLSGRAAAHLLGLIRALPAPEPEVTTCTERRVEGVTTRRSRGLDRCDVTNWRGIPVTTPARTLVDLAAVVYAGELARAMHEAGIRHSTTPLEVEDVLDRLRTAPGAAALRRVIRGDERVLLSKLERKFLGLLRGAHLPLPETNRLAGGRLVDCRWPDRKVTVELDGYHYHRSRHAWERDRQREREAYARGDQFRRYSWGDVVERPAQTIAELRSVLS
jgi:predicted transcriptional regulator of viral defense system